jgi:hypothetical protein
LVIRGVDLWTGDQGLIRCSGATELLSGMRSTAGLVLKGVPYAGSTLNQRIARLTISGRSHTVPLQVASEAEYEPPGAVFARLSAAGGHADMSMEHSPESTGPPPRRGPSVDLDPSGIVTGKSPDRQRRQFLYSFYRLDPVFRRLSPDEQRFAAAGFRYATRGSPNRSRSRTPDVGQDSRVENAGGATAARGLPAWRVGCRVRSTSKYCADCPVSTTGRCGR